VSSLSTEAGRPPTLENIVVLQPHYYGIWRMAVGLLLSLLADFIIYLGNHLSATIRCSYIVTIQASSDLTEFRGVGHMLY
jgi:hypothetical protein